MPNLDTRVRIAALRSRKAYSVKVNQYPYFEGSLRESKMLCPYAYETKVIKIRGVTTSGKNLPTATFFRSSKLHNLFSLHNTKPLIKKNKGMWN